MDGEAVSEEKVLWGPAGLSGRGGQRVERAQDPQVRWQKLPSSLWVAIWEARCGD